MINAENNSLPVHYIIHSDQVIVIPKHSYVDAMEKVLESKQDTNLSDTPPEPVSQYTLSECLCQSDLLPKQRLQLYIVFQENSGVFGSSTADLATTP